MIKPVDEVIRAFQNGQNIFRRRSVFPMVVEIETLRDKLSTVTAERDRAVEKLAFIKACGFEILTDALGRRYLSHKDRNHAYYASIYEESPHD